MSHLISLRRLRAVLLLSLVSAIGWGVVGTIIVIGVQFAIGLSVRMSTLTGAFGVFAFFGVIAGALYAVALAMLPGRDGQGVLAGWRGALYGLLSGAGVYAGLAASNLLEGAPLWLAGVFTFIGAATGLSIQRVAQRGALPAPDAAPESLTP
jgi:hypothetical protein